MAEEGRRESYLQKLQFKIARTEVVTTTTKNKRLVILLMLVILCVGSYVWALNNELYLDEDTEEMTTGGLIHRYIVIFLVIVLIMMCGVNFKTIMSGTADTLKTIVDTPVSANATKTEQRSKVITQTVIPIDNKSKGKK